ncbi:ABC transporter permease subunit [Haloarchaeobius litoreus]|uniref:ABC transporter permease subunit n=1 Tax=Haloarchaeobius litoreus TaxID=755306 RepID=A0ABD6DQE8_9EURY|nr:ABC transporter permease subunit [Haloarchaeobius litoreus]
MNWRVIARKEFEDAIRSRLLWGVVAFVSVIVSMTFLIPLLVPALDSGVLAALGGASEFASMLVPVVALVAAYLAIAGERESGSLRILLGLEPVRRTVVLGKFLGRSAVVVVGLVVGFALAGVVALGVYGSLPPVAFLAVVGLTAALGVAFVGIAVGVSAAVATRSRAMTIGIGLYLGLAILWDLVPQGAYLASAGSPPGGSVPAWFVLLQGLSPSGAYSALVMAAINATDPAYPTATAAVEGTVPFYVEPWAFAVVLFAWTVGPLLVGTLLFERADLN